MVIKAARKQQDLIVQRRFKKWVASVYVSWNLMCIMWWYEGLGLGGYAAVTQSVVATLS